MALTTAAERAYLDIIRVLLDREDTGPPLHNVWGQSPLCHAICRWWEGIVKALVGQPDLDLNEAPVGDGLTALSLGVVFGGEDLVGEGRCQCVPGRHI